MPEKLQRAKSEFKIFFNNIVKHRIGDYASQCAFFTILSFVPLILVLITLIQYINIDQVTLVNIIQKLLPENFVEFITNMIQEIYSKSIGTISISIVFTLWSAGKGFYALSKGLSVIYEKPQKSNYIYLKLKSMVYTLGFILLIGAGLLLLVFGNQIKILIINNLPSMATFWTTVDIYADLFIYIVLFITFILIYKFVPNHKVTFFSQIKGALFVTFAWGIISYAFSIYLKIFSGFSLIYGSLTTAMLLLIWVYTCMYTILLGAEINKVSNKV